MIISSKILASYLAENQDSINVSNSSLRRSNGHWQDGCLPCVVTVSRPFP